MWYGNLSILMWIEVLYMYNTYTGLELSNFTVLNQKICFKKIVWKAQNIKAPCSGIRTNDTPTIHCAMLFGNNFGKENIVKLYLILLNF